MKIGVDIGGTFTDFVVYEESTGEVQSFKLPSTPHQPERSVLEGLQRLAIDDGTVVVHGSTVATNAVLERKGARTAFIATEGFKDLLRIGRQNRTELYDFAASRPPPLVPPELSFEIKERVDRHGNVLDTLSENEIPSLIQQLQQEAVESVAICFLFSFLHPEHEQRVARALREAGLSVSLSSQVHPEFREYERASTTALNAYVMPIMDRYLGRLGDRLATEQLRIMNSNGGILSAAQAQEQPVKAILSGPAAGVVGALDIAQAAGLERVISFDMGGTSTDVSLSIGEAQLTSEGEIAGLPLRVPMIDIHTVGSGGGSIAFVDPGGLLHVGPESAGADPGPACYGRGGIKPTVTDANLVLGRLDPHRFLGGEMILHSAAAERAVGEIAALLGMSLAEAALGIIRVVNSHMASALRLVSTARGHDPRDFTLLSFGGAGGLHACDVAREVGIGSVLIPTGASTLSAYGMLAADLAKDYVQTVMMAADTPFETLKARLAHLEQEGQKDIEAQGIPSERVELVSELDLRYAGQSYELRVPFDPEFASSFHERHRAAYGYTDPDRPVEIVNLRVRALGRVMHPEVERGSLGSPDTSKALLSDTDGELAHYDGERLSPGNRIPGPAIIHYPDTTAYLGPADTANVDEQGNLLVAVGGR
ncbi:MAG: hydantoinase/oxoprolinase family protein [Anaerolineae bacterium]|nr:MAG: hydantoinase/oxoprolinase family protein [Anaerolineae bacterium]